MRSQQTWLEADCCHTRLSQSTRALKMALTDTIAGLSWIQLIAILLVAYVVSVYYARASKWYRIRKLGGHSPRVQTWFIFGATTTPQPQVEANECLQVSISLSDQQGDY
jgi:hypothetical protein